METFNTPPQRAVDLLVPESFRDDIIGTYMIRATRRRSDSVVSETLASFVYEMLHEHELLLEVDIQDEVRIRESLIGMAQQLLIIFPTVSMVFAESELESLAVRFTFAQEELHKIIQILLKTADLERAAVIREQGLREASRRSLEELKKEMSRLEGMLGRVPELEDEVRRTRARIQLLESEVLIDEKTGLMTQKAFEDALPGLLQSESPLGLVMADFSGMKEINDSFGHGIGDLAIMHTARVITEAVRHGDLVARSGKGADEFLVALRVTNIDEFRKAVSRLAERFGNTPLVLPIGEEPGTLKAADAKAYVAAWEKGTVGYNRSVVTYGLDGKEELHIFIANAFGGEWLTDACEFKDRLPLAEAKMYDAKRLSKGIAPGSPATAPALNPPQNAFMLPGEDSPTVFPHSAFEAPLQQVDHLL